MINILICVNIGLIFNGNKQIKILIERISRVSRSLSFKH